MRLKRKRKVVRNHLYSKTLISRVKHKHSRTRMSLRLPIRIYQHRSQNQRIRERYHPLRIESMLTRNKLPKQLLLSSLRTSIDSSFCLINLINLTSMRIPRRSNLSLKRISNRDVGLIISQWIQRWLLIL